MLDATPDGILIEGTRGFYRSAESTAAKHCRQHDRVTKLVGSNVQWHNLFMGRNVTYIWKFRCVQKTVEEKGTS